MKREQATRKASSKAVLPEPNPIGSLIGFEPVHDVNRQLKVIQLLEDIKALLQQR
jgi:hypothetical protein